jgi:hypothetical protein
MRYVTGQIIVWIVGLIFLLEQAWQEKTRLLSDGLSLRSGQRVGYRVGVDRPVVNGGQESRGARSPI